MASITFDASLTTDKLDRAVLESKRKIGQWSRDIEQSTEKVDEKVNKLSRTFEGQGQTTERVLKREKGLIEDIRNTIQEYEKAKAKAWKVEHIEHYNKKIAEAKQHLKEYEEAGVNANEKVEKSTNKLKTAWMGIVAAIASAMAAFNALKNEVLASETGLNRYNITLAVTKQLMYDIVHRTGKGDINFLKEWLQNAKDAAEAQRRLNELRVEERENLIKSKAYQIAYNQFLSEAKDQTASVTERIKAYDAAFIALNKSIDIAKTTADKRLVVVQDLLKTQSDSEILLEEEARLILELMDLDNRRWSSQKEITSMRSGLKKKEAEDELKRIKDIEDINNSIAEQKKLLQAAIDKGNKKEIEAIAARIVKLEEELALREKLTQQAIAGARAEHFRGFVPTQIGGGFAMPSVIPEPEKVKPKSWIEQRAEMDALRIVDVKKKQAEIEKTILENLEKQAVIRQQIVKAVADLVYELGQQIGLTEQELKTLESTLTAAEQMASGDYIGAAATVLQNRITLLTNIIKLIPTEASRFEAQIERINALIEKQQRLIEQSRRTGGTREALQEEIDFLLEEIDLYAARIAEAEKTLNKWLTLPFAKVKARKVIAESKEMIDALNEMLEDAYQRVDEFITGGITQIDIAGILRRGFEDGKKSAKDFADDFDRLMRNAINHVLEEASKPSITAWYSKFAADMASAGGLDAGEIVALKKEWDEIVAAEKERREQVYAIAGITETAMANIGLSGQIRRDITEETGTELAALFRRYADEQRVVKDYSILGVTHLIGIEKNTYDTVERLDSAIIELQSIVTNTKQPAVGGLG